jgi:uncharacterized protein YbaP (TraB family)
MKHSRLAIIFFLFLFSCAFYKPHIPGYFFDDGYYKNDYAGFKVWLPDDWVIGTTPKTVPEEFKETLKLRQSENSEVLFIGTSPNKRCGVMCIAEGSDTTLDAYFKQLYYASENTITKGRADYYQGRGQELVIWSYYTNTNAARFRYNEYICNAGNLKIRLNFWTLAGLYDDYRKVFEGSAQTICLADTTPDTSKIWNDKPVWIARDSSEATINFDYATDKKELYFASDAADTICNGKDKSFLFKVTDGTASCYLLGSIHLLKPEMYPLKKVIETAFDSSTSLVLEVNTELPGNQQKMASMAKEGMYTAKESLKQNITPKLYSDVTSWAQKRGIPVAVFDKLKPWMAAIVLQQLQMQSLGLSPEYGVEKYFLKKNAKKEILELETAEEQMALFSSVKGDDFLAYTLFDIENTEAQTKGMLKSWSCGNTDAMRQIVFGNAPAGSEELLNKFFYARNIKMVEKIKQFMKSEKKCFVIIGSGHLIGERSIIDLLEKSGMKVEQM